MPVKESSIQRYIVKQLFADHRFGKEFSVFSCPNEGKRSRVNGWHLKLMGLRAGWPDLGLLMRDGQVRWIELKLKGNYLESSQKEIHAELKGLGHDVVTITAIDEFDGWKQVREQMRKWGIA